MGAATPSLPWLVARLLLPPGPPLPGAPVVTCFGSIAGAVPVYARPMEWPPRPPPPGPPSPPGPPLPPSHPACKPATFVPPTPPAPGLPPGCSEHRDRRAPRRRRTRRDDREILDMRAARARLRHERRFVRVTRQRALRRRAEVRPTLRTVESAEDCASMRERHAARERFGARVHRAAGWASASPRRSGVRGNVFSVFERPFWRRVLAKRRWAGE